MKRLTLLLLLLLSSSAVADGFDDAYEEARAHFVAGRIEVALQALEQMVGGELEPAQEALVWFSMGRCHQTLGRHETAIEYFDRTLEIAPPDAIRIRGSAEREREESRKARWASLSVLCPEDLPVEVSLVDRSVPATTCPAEFTDLEPGPVEIELRWKGRAWPPLRRVLASGAQERVEVPHPARLTVESTVEGSMVAIDGEAMGSAPVREVVLPPGAYRVTVSAPAGYRPWRQVVHLAAGQAVHLDAMPVLDEPSVSGWIWVATGVGVAGLVAGGVMAYEAVEARDTADAHYAMYRLAPVAELDLWARRTRAADARADRWVVSSAVSFGASLLAGGALVWLALDADDVSVAPMIGGDGAAGLQLRLPLD